MLVFLTATSGAVAAWALFSLRRELTRLPDREPLWRRAILTRREDLRVGAFVTAATSGAAGIMLISLEPSQASLPGPLAALTIVATGSAVLSLTPAADRRLVVYRDEP